jgi:molybdate transport system substrate-binding protein
MIHAVGLAIVLGVASQTQPVSPASGTPVRIAAASDLRFALDEIVIAFRALHPNTLVEPVYGSSGNFFAQIREGAPFDLFLSADSEYAQRLHAEGIGGRPFSYAIGRLALVVRKESGLDPKGLGDLLRSPAIRRLAIANPAHAPYGRAAEAALRTWRIYDLVAPRLVRGDSVSQAAQFIDTGNAQAALVALSLVKGKSEGLVFAEVPESAHPPLDQAGLILKRTTVPEAARAFQAFLTGEAGRGILARYGFGLPARQ